MTNIDTALTAPETLAQVRKDIGRRATTYGTAPYGFTVMGSDGLSWRIWARTEITTTPGKIHHGDLTEIQVLLEDTNAICGEIPVAVFPCGAGTSTRVIADCIVAIIRQTDPR